MIELNKTYSSKTLAVALGITYGTLRVHRKEYEEHLAKFYVYTKSNKANATYYLFTEEIVPYISYKKYKDL